MPDTRTVSCTMCPYAVTREEWSNHKQWHGLCRWGDCQNKWEQGGYCFRHYEKIYIARMDEMIPDYEP